MNIVIINNRVILKTKVHCSPRRVFNHCINEILIFIMCFLLIDLNSLSHLISNEMDGQSIIFILLSLIFCFMLLIIEMCRQILLLFFLTWLLWNLHIKKSENLQQQVAIIDNNEWIMWLYTRVLICGLVQYNCKTLRQYVII